MHAGGSENVIGDRLPVVETSLIVTFSLCRTGKFEIYFEEEFELFPVKEFSVFQEILKVSCCRRSRCRHGWMTGTAPESAVAPSELATLEQSLAVSTGGRRSDQSYTVSL